MMSSEEVVERKSHPILELPQQGKKSAEATTLITSQTISNPLLSGDKFISHHPKAGLNPLVDNAAYLFSIIGRLKQIKSYRHLHKLHKELTNEINLFQERAKTLGYNSEYILVSRYALCATLDDIIENTSWGSQGQWDSYSLLTTFSQESSQQERFFIILERLIKNPNLYIELMEFMYFCLSLGYKGSFRSTEFSHNQLEQICNSLYKRIRAHHGDISRTLSSFTKPPTPHQHERIAKPSIGLAIIVSCCIILSIFIGLGFLLDTISNQTYQELLHIGKSLFYETHDSSSL